MYLIQLFMKKINTHIIDALQRSVVVSEGFDFIQWLTGISWDYPLPTELSEQRQFWKEQL
ncbi:hypothetical protein T4D_12947 [Trichinella pseudospiralis]|uniref:Uncharacterized protein n=1 Tax=Trichinella pseudospiralis TaxID=6337 RepID=A0A0V1FKS9_TRIPS|nr:hypothetical protein T4D_9651 [Trichinella pseudospiralis]KRY86618.1 hypothetical protein T4D_12947 [Trichinella pseudospiralis]